MYYIFSFFSLMDNASLAGLCAKKCINLCKDTKKIRYRVFLFVFFR